MDLKVLFHNPEDLSDDELKHLRKKIQQQRSMPWISAFIGGFSLYLFDEAFIRRHYCYKRIAVGALVVFAFGAHASYQVPTSITRKLDTDIVNAFDRRYMNAVLNSTGFGTNYVSSRDYSNGQ